MRRCGPRECGLGRGLAGFLIAFTLAASAAAQAPTPSDATAAPSAGTPPAPPTTPPPETKPEAKPEATPETKPEAKPEAKPETKPENVPPLPVETLDPTAAMPILGKKVRDAAGADMGLIVDVLSDRDGAPIAAVIDVGGFLGVGSRKIALAWHLLQFHPEDSKAPIVVPLDRAQVQAAPEYKPSAPPVKIVRAPDENGTGADSGK